MVWEPDNFCCCMTPKVGTMVIGWISIIVEISSLLTLLQSALLGYGGWEEICDDWMKEDPDWFSPNLCSRAIMSFIIVSILASVVGVVISALLLVGINKKKQVLMLPYMICLVIFIIFFCIDGLGALVFFLKTGEYEEACAVAIIGGLVMFLMVYFFLVVRVCHNEVKEHERRISTESRIPFVEQQHVSSNI